MNKIAGKLSIALLAAATVIAPMSTTVAQAGGLEFYEPNQHFQYKPNRAHRWSEHHGAKRHYYRHHRSHRYNDNSDAIALGIIGLGAAAIIGGAIANSNNPRVIYRTPSAPRAVSGGKYEPWSRSWYRYCSNKFRSFNASTGTYRGYDGRDHFCVAR